MDAVIYAARSKDEEPGKDSTGDQVAAIEKQLDDRTVIGAPHIDHASGFKRDRGPGLEAAIAAAVAAAPSELWVFHSSRLARGSGEQEEARSLMELLVYLRRHGVTVRSIEDDAFVTNRMLWGVAEELSHKYSADLSAHTRKGKRSAREKGRWPGGPIPDGFRLSARDPDTDTRNLVEDEERAPIIRRAFELRREGLSLGAIARRLNDEGHRTRPQPARGIHDGLPFTPTRIRDMLANATYAGLVVDRSGEEPVFVQGTWDWIVDPDIFKLVGLKIRMRKAQPSKGGRPPTAFALGGLAACGKCGRPMKGRKSAYVRKDGSKQRFYLCSDVAEKTGTCDAPRFDAAVVDDAVVHYLGGRFIDFDAWAKEQADAVDQERASIERELGRRRKALAKLQRERDAVRKAYTEKITPAREHALEAVLQEVKTAQEGVEETEAELVARPVEPPADAMLDIYSALRRTLEDDKAPLNERLKRLFDRFVMELVDDDGREMIAILPVLRTDAIKTDDEQHLIEVLDGETRVAHHQRVLFAPDDALASPVLLLVPPPMKGVRVPLIGTGSNACA